MKKKEIKKMDLKFNYDLDAYEINGKQHHDSRIDEIAEKINEIIDKLNEITKTIKNI